MPPTTAQPLFVYYPAAGAQPLTLSVPATAAERVAIDSIDIVLRVRTSANWGTPATTVTMRVALPNADYARNLNNNGGS